MHATGDYSSSAVPAFLHKLWTLVEDEGTNDLIAWDPSGHSFHVFDQGRFSKEVLPLYFKHNNIASFIRQLNMYGFRKVTNVDHGGLKIEKDDMEFVHQYFRREEEHLLENIKRKVSNTVTGKADDVKVKHDDVTKVLMDVHHLRGKQDHINSKFDTLKRENEALWREVATLRQKHLKQEKIVSKLIQFLVTIVGPRGLAGMKRPARRPLMLNDAEQLQQMEQGVRPTKVARRSNPVKLEPRQNINTMQAQAVHSEPVSSVQIEDVSVTESAPQPSSERLLAYPTTSSVSSQDVTPQTFIVYNSPSQIQEPALSPDYGSQTATSPPPYSSVFSPPQPATSPQLSTDSINQYEQLTSEANFDTEGNVFPDYSTLTGGELAGGELAGGELAVDVSSTENEDANDPVLQALTQTLPSTSSTTVALSPHQQTVNSVSDDVDVIHDSLEGLKDLLAIGTVKIDPTSQLFGFQLDNSTLHGLFHPEAPVPPTPEPLLNLGLGDDGGPSYSDAASDNQLVQYVPTEEFGSLFDLDLDLDNPDVFGADQNEPGTTEMSTPIYNLSSPLAERRKSKPSMSTSKPEDVD